MNLFRQQMQEVVVEVLRDIWEDNYSQNKKTIIKSSNFPSRKGQIDKAALCIGAGPSFELNLQFIQPEFYDIVACDKVVPTLADKGIIPKYIVALNAQHTEVQDWLEPMYDLCNRENACHPALVMPIGVYPSTYKSWSGELIFVNAMLPTYLHQRVKRELHMEPIIIGSNSGTFAYRTAFMFGYNPIGFIGMDFSFLTREEIMARQDPDNYNIVEISDYMGAIRYTTLGWFDMAQAFQEFVTEARHLAGVTTVNCCEGGINLSESCHSMSLEDFNQELDWGWK